MRQIVVLSIMLFFFPGCGAQEEPAEISGESVNTVGQFLAFDTFDDDVARGNLPTGWELSIGYPDDVFTLPGKDGKGQRLFIDGGKGEMSLSRFFQPQKEQFTVELDLSPVALPRGLVALYIGGDFWAWDYKEWPVCLKYEFKKDLNRASQFSYYDKSWRMTEILPGKNHWYHLKYVIDVPNQCFDLWLDGANIVSKGAFRNPTSEISCLMFYMMPRDEKVHDELLINNLKIYEGTSVPPNGAAVTPVLMPNRKEITSDEHPINKSGYRLTFNDEFSDNTLDANLWNFGRFPTDAVIDETRMKEIYPYELKDGVIKLRVEKRGNTSLDNEAISDYTQKAIASYTAPAIATWNKFEQAYGWFEIRCKMPKAYGIWEGFWLVPVKSYRGAGTAEIDVFESLSRINDRIHLALHPHWDNGAEYVNQGIRVPGLADDFHVYAINWEPEKLTYYVDGKPIGEYTGTGLPSKPLYLIVSCRTGGWAGTYVDESALPDDFEIDYVRVYQKE